MNYARITQVNSISEQIVTNDDLAKIMDTSDEWISSRTGVNSDIYLGLSQQVI